MKAYAVESRYINRQHVYAVIRYSAFETPRMMGYHHWKWPAKLIAKLYQWGILNDRE